ncbi:MULTISPECIES: M23 family metallopeptidase [unclassified Leptolyngbya]|uniref:M23 family metallopeptidase n=1 Tax=unclassified Leptolyngbya TaxID=2650499 RepID=UPI0016879329|nr:MULTISPECIES: M23 family metallopeptidase [unclassified Leptolyngbya]MBD1912563.1 M23 family metallopeptidase [Leptolyngbya sp. FACHB-8]MBD2158473.1 M23 family metallopeptidase [Leptolyngbya sp. FACHB-16]
MRNTVIPQGRHWQAIRKYLGKRFWWLGVLVGAIALLTATVTPAQTSDVIIRPTSPQLGDTISVILQTNDGTAPTIAYDGASYSSFPVGSNRYRALLPTTPLDRPGRKVIQFTLNGEPRSFAVELRNRRFPTQSIRVGGGTSTEATDYELNRLREFREAVSPQKFWSGPFARPADGRVSSEYGIRRYYNGEFAQDYYHKGVDYAGGTGSPIYAPAAGRVMVVGRVADGFRVNGNTIAVDHGQGVGSVFIHLSRIDVQEGDMVQPGQRIGAIGATGLATGPNLHWGLYVNGKSVDPVPWRQGGFE